MSTTVKRSQLAHYLNTGTPGAPDWALIGDGITDAEIAYNPQTTEEVFIHQDSGSTEIESYKPTLPIEGSAKDGDDVYDYVENLRVNRAVLGDAQSELVNVWLWKTPTAGAYPAEKQTCSIQLDKLGGPGGESNKIGYTINFVGDPVIGTFHPGTLTFTPA